MSALYRRRDDAEAAVRALQRAGLRPEQIVVAGPAIGGVRAGSPDAGGDLHLRRVSSTRRDILLGGIAGMLLAMLLIAVQGSGATAPAWSLERLLALAYGLFGGAVAGGLLAALEGRSSRISAVANVARHGHWAVVVKVDGEAEAREVYRVLQAGEEADSAGRPG